MSVLALLGPPRLRYLQKNRACGALGAATAYALDNPKKSRLQRSWGHYALDNPKKIAPAAHLGPPRTHPVFFHYFCFACGGLLKILKFPLRGVKGGALALGRPHIIAHYNLHHCAFLPHYLIHIIAFSGYITWLRPNDPQFRHGSVPQQAANGAQCPAAGDRGKATKYH